MTHAFAAVAIGLPLWAAPSYAQVIEMTKDVMVDLRMNSSYQVRYVNMQTEQSALNLQASNATLRSRVNLTGTYSTRAAAENVFNSSLGRDVTVYSERSTSEAELSIRQPVIVPFVGYPTNGFITLATSVFQRTQPGRGGGAPVTDFANDYNLRYTQPLFQPNVLKNNLERAELDFESQAMNNLGQLNMVQNQAENDYFELFRSRYEQIIGEEYVGNLARTEGIAVALSQTDPAKAIELRQIQVELSNARQELDRQRSDYRNLVVNLTTTLGLSAETEFRLDPVIVVNPVSYDPAEVVALVMERSRRLRNLGIQQRRNELSLDQTEGQNGMRINLDFAYGREVQNAIRFGDLWITKPDNTYTVSITAAVPVWDWGQADARIENSRLNLDRSRLQRDEAETQIRTQVENEIRNVEERQARAITLQGTLALSREVSAEGLDLYESGSIGIQELLRSLVRQRDTDQSLLEAYVSWEQSRRSLEDMLEGGQGFGGQGGGGGNQGGGNQGGGGGGNFEGGGGRGGGGGPPPGGGGGGRGGG